MGKQSVKVFDLGLKKQSKYRFKYTFWIVLQKFRAHVIGFLFFYKFFSIFRKTDDLNRLQRFILCNRHELEFEARIENSDGNADFEIAINRVIRCYNRMQPRQKQIQKIWQEICQRLFSVRISILQINYLPPASACNFVVTGNSATDINKANLNGNFVCCPCLFISNSLCT